ncbi:MAG: PIN domain-containing protein [Dehalococcoidia bacterium]|nr:PIN domain-containing protein [Dehalococcoidia bacterium]
MTPPELAEAYVDSSALIAVGFGEANAALVSRRLANFGRLTSSNLLEAEVRAAFAREGHEFDPGLLAPVRWIFPNRPLVAEITAVLQAGYLRGADLWHVANALYAARTMPGLAFITLDQRQQAVASGLGFQI